jgi:dihydroorotase
MSRVAYVNARLLDPASGLDSSGALLCDGELINDFGPELFKDGVPEGINVVDCEGFCLMPGLVDMRVQLREPGEEYKGTLESAGRTASAGGVTSMVCLPNTNPVIDDISVLEFVARRARKLGLAKVHSYGAVTKGLEGKELAEIGLLWNSGALAFTDGIKPVSNSRIMGQALSYASNFGQMIIQHAEEQSLARGGVMNSGETATRLGLSGIPREAEIIMVERDIRLAEMTRGRLHFAHLSTSDSIDVVRKAKARGLNITCDTAPPYFSLSEIAVGDYRTFAKLSPPLRADSDRLAVIEGLKDGTIDTIASDHAPHDEESKRLPFAYAAFGGVGLETLLAITLELFHNGHLDLLNTLKLITSSPSDLLGLKAGRLKKGSPADLTLIDVNRGWKVDADAMQSISKNSPFDGRPVQGSVLMTIVDGRKVFDHRA